MTENCLREGMQIESAEITVADKLRLLDTLSKTGLEHIVVGAFVSARYTPQMAEIDEIVRRLQPVPGVRYSVLALNEQGRERAARHTPPLAPEQSAPILLCHLCDTFVRRNTNRSQADEIASWPAIVEAAARSGATEARIGIGAAFGSNFTGDVSTADRMEMLARQHALWSEAGIPVAGIQLLDPMGWVTPWAVEEQLVAVLDRWPEITSFDLHFHNPRGLALASAYAALRVLDERHSVHFDTSAGGIGGCPYCGTGRATGMIATEDIVNMLEQLGVSTGVDLPALVRAVWLLEEIIGRPAFGFVSKAGWHPHGEELFDPNLPCVETFEEARHFLLGPSVAEHQRRPWAEPIPASHGQGA